MSKLTNKRFGRYQIVIAFIVFYIVLSQVVRTVLLFLCHKKASLSFFDISKIYLKGFVFDIGTATFLSFVGIVYLLLFPTKYIGKKVDKVIVYIGLFLTVFIVYFATFAEFTFWGEFESRFNFIAVDYLLYTYEVVENINQSYPLPLLITGMVLCSVGTIFLFKKMGIFQTTFSEKTTFGKRFLLYFFPFLVIAFVYIICIPNRWAEQGNNNYADELSKNGIYSFFAAFRSNELPYQDFYLHKQPEMAVQQMRSFLKDDNTSFIDSNTIYRRIKSNSVEQKPNVILITIESFSADFMAHFGNKKNITPNIDRIADSSLLFRHLYATGTRTVRGMEALTLSIPPTPGNSIVRRSDNKGLFSIGSVFKSKGYNRTFFYGGDGYFDNMNNFFSGIGFDIVDKGRNFRLKDGIQTKRSIISDRDVHFKNAWGICDEDLLDAVLKNADQQYQQKQPFFDFIMTTSNHKPYTYPSGKIDIPSGSGRDGAVKYTDYAIGHFLEKAAKKSWFSNTVFVIVADHCASSAGKDAVEVSKYHIPCLIFNLATRQGNVDQLCSQIDIFPTLFSLLGWDYKSSLFGRDVFSAQYMPRALPASYQVLGYMEKNNLTLLSPVNKSESLYWNYQEKEMPNLTIDSADLEKTITYYQSAYTLYKSGQLKDR
ncbi:MAG: sulfatase [Pseudopedobacter saltans]|uniref:Sulfatase n=1 Tax=Pseudopedobacter saltans TaxID=151895 RepID=A0A2W5F3T6_9SPHI|nr:MAG: sulfatase [Pseudopedobacter saltans]